MRPLSADGGEVGRLWPGRDLSPQPSPAGPAVSRCWPPEGRGLNVSATRASPVGLQPPPLSLATQEPAAPSLRRV